MRVLITILFLGIYLITNAQKTITYEKLRDEITNSSEPDCISIYSYQLEQKSELYLIDLSMDCMLSEPPLFDAKTKKQLTAEIVINSAEMKEIVDALDSNGFFDTLYVRTDTVYTNIKTLNDYFVINKTLILIEILHYYDSWIMQTYLKVDDKVEVDELLVTISDILSKSQRKLFKQYLKNIKGLEN